MEGVNGRSGLSAEVYTSYMVPGHQNFHVTHTAQTDKIRTSFESLTEGVVELGAKSNYQKDLRENQQLKRAGSKVTRKVAAFGPAHADQARKLYQFKATQPIRSDKIWTSFLSSSNMQFGRHILLSHHEQDLMSANGGHLLEEPVYHRNLVHYIDLKKKWAPSSLQLESQPILKIVTISPRPNGASARKSKISFNAKHLKTFKAGLVKDERVNSEDKTKQKDPSRLTIFQILGEISRCVYLN